MSAAWTPVLSGIVGSTAYGLAGPDSDVDRLAFAAAGTADLHGLHPPAGKRASRVTTGPDVTTHEIGKAVALLLSCNPTVNELLWLDSYETRTPLGDELIGLRTSLLHAKGVRDAYLGYATQQFKRLREHGRFPSNVAKRTAKHGRHLLRLCRQAQELHATGNLTLRVRDPWTFHEFGQRLVDQPERGLVAAENTLTATRDALESTTSALPEHPDEAAAEAWLRRARAHHYRQENAA